MIRTVSHLSTKSLLLLVVAALALPTSAMAGHQNFRSNSVGGISIDAQGVVSLASVDSQRMLRAEMLKALEKAPGELNAPVPMRKVSLRGLNAAIKDAQENNLGVLPDEVKYLAGLQRIEYVFVYPEQNDIVLAGPGEGWTVDEYGTVVGVTTGRPVLLLEDLVVALQTVENARNGGITCSIDPTEQGRVNFHQYMKSVRQFSPAAVKGIEAAMGMQDVTVHGVPQTSHFARVLVGADYRMKRIAMGHDKSGVRGLPSFVDIASVRALQANAAPRWWLACNYEPLAKSEDGLAWQLRGPGVKAMTEDEIITEDGKVVQTGKEGALAKKWADLMTAQYEELSGEDKIFGELRNIMDMCVVAALISKENMLKKANIELPMLGEATNSMTQQEYYAPKNVPSIVSALKKGNNWVLTVSGGVDINSWAVADNNEAVPTMEPLREQNAKTGGATWWWN
ncbi:DUF1598 domain-containing protein [Blastopirellula sp. JC732]|uniref:DUF1598 domain-containing protein n=1 Tax=Blastopirellula sediminis TaxID=2894196 RepID=A0A9X1SJC5_9BACT|nr:DUF1598 domain-containing protein [Blastopirellula sediminis]MCC9604469.1 DUF1598 domain-containing protein [Blastopirellula sediminis]MCC9632232.1 DUF1598 domain-containing protein [Blastopirellula sediminis]